MQDSGEGDASLVVVEAGAAWPACAGEYQQAQPNSVVEVQPDTESHVEFTARVERRIASIRKRGAVRVALVAANESLDTVSLRGRHGLATLLAASMDGTGELVLTASVGSNAERVSHELFALAGALCDELRGSNVSVSVRFSDRASESGLRPSYSSIVDEAEAASN
jgi:hypothetical protein